MSWYSVVCWGFLLVCFFLPHPAFCVSECFFGGSLKSFETRNFSYAVSCIIHVNLLFLAFFREPLRNNPEIPQVCGLQTVSQCMVHTVPLYLLLH